MDPGFYKHDRQESPRIHANFFSAYSYWWLRELLTKGFKTQLEIDDLYVPLKDHCAENLGALCRETWENELKKSKPSLLRVLVKLYGVRLLIVNIVYSVIDTFFRISQPLCLGVLLSYFSPGQVSISKNEAYMYASGVVLSMLVNTFLLHPFLLEMLYTSTKIRISCSSLIYKKVLKLNLKASSSEEGLNGKIINLLTNDVSRFDMCCVFLMEVWRAPIESTIVIYVMYRNIGPASLIGVTFLLCFIPLQAWFSRINAGLRIRTAVKTDHRIKIMNEIIQGIQMIKMYAWENCFVKMIAFARQKEMNLIRKITWIRAVSLCCIKLNAKISIFISILAYVFFGNEITAAKIFVLFSLYDLIKLTLVEFFSLSLLSTMEAYVSVWRIQEFLLLPEMSMINPNSVELNMIKINDKNINHGINIGLGKNGYDLSKHIIDEKEIFNGKKKSIDEPILELKNLNATWNTKDSQENIKENIALDNVSLNVSSGELVAIVGQVGSGKSVLFSSIIGEVSLKSGLVQINGIVSYCSQSPWLFEATIRQNILFGLKMNPLRYRQVLKCCQLETDLKSFPFGDKTIVGERGISLSGGQKARVSLARCVYRQADLYLLDDPLSAVDAKVAHELFNSCIRGFLKSSAVIFVTHQLQHLSKANKVCVMDSGKIVFEDSYKNFQKSSFNTAELFNVNNENEQKDIKFGDQEISDENCINRRMSVTSVSSKLSIDQVMEHESQKAGSVNLDVYKSFAKSAGGIYMLLFILILFISGQVMFSLCDWWLSVWVNLEELASNAKNNITQIQNTNFTEMFDFDNNTVISNTSENQNAQTLSYTGLSSWNLTRDECIYIYSGFIAISIVVTLSKLILFFNMCITASVNLHNYLFQGVIRATMWFFNNNASGRILNRFSKDMGTIDNLLPPALADCLSFFFETIGILVIVCTVNYWLLIPTLILTVILTMIRAVYISTSRSLKRLEGISRSPAFTHVNATLNGLETIRSSSSQDVLSAEFDRHLNLHTSVWTLILNTNRAFAFWMDLVCCLYLALVTYSFLILSSNDVLGGKVGLAITQVIGLVGMCQWGMRQTAEVENQMTSVERISEYTKLPSEPPLETNKDEFNKLYPNIPLKNWPYQGNLEFKHVFLRYDKNEENFVLKDVNFKVKSGDKVGIVGRTGAGKSSIIAALFRLTETDGNIILDGVETKTLGLHDLRPAMSIIPQEPMLFSGSLRKNLDPWDQYSDKKLWEVLEEVELKAAISNMAGGLDTKVADGGNNFSAGQKQLLCLARAALRNAQLLLLDEATANVDPETDQLIQKTIRRKFSDKTVLTIAHRLHTVMDSDKVLVMDGGKVVEYDHPFELLNTKENLFFNSGLDLVNDSSQNVEKTIDSEMTADCKKGFFLSLVQQTGKQTFDMLFEIAKKSYEKNQALKKLD